MLHVNDLNFLAYMLAPLFDIRVPNMFNFLFLITVTHNICKTIDGKRKKSKNNMQPYRAACFISARFYGHCTGTVRQSCYTRTGSYDYLKPTIIVRLFCPNDELKSSVLHTMSVRCASDLL